MTCKQLIRLTYGVVTLIVGILYVNAEGDIIHKDTSLTLWYNQPATEWLEALPIGNGHLGAMVFGGVEEERIQFNEHTLWTGKPHDYSHAGAANHLNTIRELLFAGQQAAAEEHAMKYFMSIPFRQQAFQPFGNLHVRFQDHDSPLNYHRELDLETALATTRYQIGETMFRRTVFASYPDRVIVVHIEADKPGSVSFTANLSSPHAEPDNWADVKTMAADDTSILLRGRFKGAFIERNPARQNDRLVNPYRSMNSALRFESRLKVETDSGEVVVTNDHIQVHNANSATLILSAATSFVNFQDISGNPSLKTTESLKKASDLPFSILKKRHVQDHSSLFNQNTLDLGGGHLNQLPANERIVAFQETPDPAVITLLYQYGRYLLIACSRPGGQPANLQGIWNNDMHPAWESKYTININIQMNYWIAELTGLSETHEPLFDAIDDLVCSGAKVAKAHYDASGWVLHHNFDLWRGAAPINQANHGIWVTGGAWLTQHLWSRYSFTGDEDFLRERAYPAMKEASRFFLDYLVEDPIYDQQWLVSGPSNSPEQGGLVMGPAMDHQIIRYLFLNTAKAAEILGLDPAFRVSLEAAADRVAPDQVGSFGQLQEWLYVEDPETNHRHVSHLWAVHPGNAITPETPELFEAAKKSLDMRGDGGTGWSRAWKVNFWARFLDGERAYRLLKGIIQPADNRNPGVYANFFGAHPPYQIDGNFGATAGVVEMLLQSHREYQNTEWQKSLQILHRIHLLPAIPSVWDKGKVTGLRARDGFVVDITWEDGILVEAVLESLLGRTAVVAYKNNPLTVMKDGKPIEAEHPEPGVTVFSTDPKSTYTLRLSQI